MEDNKKDKWQLALDEPLKQLLQCQKDKNIDSCFKCEQILTCTIREDYVKAVYESMNKGSGGGFEF